MATIKTTPRPVNIECYQGDTLNLAFIFTDENGDPSDMTDVDAVLIFELDGIDNIIIGEGLEWGVDDNAHILYLSKKITWTGSSKYELQRTFPDASIKTGPIGKFKSKPQLDEIDGD